MTTLPEFTEKDLPALPEWVQFSAHDKFHAQELQNYALAAIDAYRKRLAQETALQALADNAQSLGLYDAAPMPQAEQPKPAERSPDYPGENVAEGMKDLRRIAVTLPTRWTPAQSALPVQDEREAFEERLFDAIKAGVELAFKEDQDDTEIYPMQVYDSVREMVRADGVLSCAALAQAQASGQAAPNDSDIQDVMVEFGRPNDEAGTMSYTGTQIVAASRALLSRYGQAPAVPEGMALVSAWKLRRAAKILDKDGDEHGIAADIFAMLADAAAAPTPPASAAPAADGGALLHAVDEFRQAFVIAVGDKSPFARVALGKIDAAMAAGREG